MARSMNGTVNGTVLAVLAALLVVGSVPRLLAQAGGDLAGDIAKGRNTATTICVACHMVGKGEFISPAGAAPAFGQLATTSGMTSIALSAALQTSHRQMPNIILQPDDRRDIIAYILSLK